MSLQSEIGNPDYRYAVKYHDGVNNDIQKVLENAFAISVKEAAPIAYRFKGENRIDTAKKIYTYLKNDITYEKDPEGYQDIRRPRFFHHTRTGDCKSFTLNTLAIWANLYPTDKLYFFYAAYDGGDVPTHVYAIIEPRNEAPIIIDGCWYFFNSEKNYTLGFKSRNMQIRELSGIGAVVPHDTGTEFIQKVYASLNPRQKVEFKNMMQKKLSFELLKAQREADQISAIECMEKLEAIEGIGRVKRKGKGKKFLHWFNAAALFLGRASFLLFVTLNVNGLASKLAQLHKWGRDKGVMDTWYMLGGNTKKFLKIIEKGSGKKKLFLSKKAKAKYEQRYGPLSPNEVQFEKGVHGADNGIYGPELAAAAVAVVPVLAALVPKMINGFRAAGPQGHAMAAGLIADGHDIANDMQNNGYGISHNEVNAFLPNGQHANFSGRLDPRANGQAKKYGVVFDLQKFYSPIADDATDAAADTPPPADANTTIPGGSPDGTIQVSPPAENPMDKFNEDMKTLGPLLSTVAQVGLTTAGTVMSQSKNPNIRKWGGALDGAESVLTANALRKAGYPKDADFHDKIHAGTNINMAGVLFWSGIGYVGYQALKN